MAVADQAAVVPAQKPRRWPGLLLLIAASIEFMGGLGGLPILAGNFAEVPGPGLPTLINILAVVAFGISVAIYGF